MVLKKLRVVRRIFLGQLSCKLKDPHPFYKNSRKGSLRDKPEYIGNHISKHNPKKIQYNHTIGVIFISLTSFYNLECYFSVINYEIEATATNLNTERIFRLSNTFWIAMFLLCNIHF